MTQVAKSITGSGPFRVLVIGTIVFSGVLAGLETDAGLLARHRALFAGLDAAVLCIFVAELALKLIGHGRRLADHFRDGWNVFDALIVVLCLVPSVGPFAAVLRTVRVLRVLRVLRLVTALPKLQLLVGALIKSLSAMGYVSLLLGLLFYIYAVAGVHLFGKAGQADFATLPAALFTLFRTVTLDNWGEFFTGALVHSPGLVVSVYFVTFIVFGTMIILNLFIGVITHSMTEAHAEQSERLRAGSAKSAGPGDEAARIDAVDRQVAALQTALDTLREQLRDLRRSSA